MKKREKLRESTEEVRNCAITSEGGRKGREKDEMKEGQSRE